MPMKLKLLLLFPMMSTNSEISDIFNKIADSLDILSENAFKIRAYKKASKNILELSADLKNFKNKSDIQNIPGVGNDLADKIMEYTETGKIDYYENLKNKVPPSLLELLRIQGVGPKFLSILFNKFNVKNIESFEKALGQKSLLEVKGIGIKKIEDIKKGINIFKEGKKRIILSEAFEIAQNVIKEIEKIKGTQNTQIAGSLRRMQETIGDIDLITSAEDTKSVIKAFTSLPIVKTVLANGETKGSIVVENGIQVDLRAIKPDEYGAAIQYFSGSQLHNVRVRSIALKLGYKINEYGLYEGEKKIAGKSEADIYNKLGMDFIQPELREDRGEIEASSEYRLPNLVELKDIKGDLHTHSTWSDGKSSIEEMALTARSLGYEYIAITDHSISSRIANGLDEKRLFEKKEEVEK
ncbi:MAG: helix-hairpin-helix domain-containing protein, partial [Thermodesulfobacteriota bacterium]